MTTQIQQAPAAAAKGWCPGHRWEHLYTQHWGSNKLRKTQQKGAVVIANTTSKPTLLIYCRRLGAAAAKLQGRPATASFFFPIDARAQPGDPNIRTVKR